MYWPRSRAGRRRLELFGHDHNIRPGWVTVGNELTSSNFDPAVRSLQPTTPPSTHHTFHRVYSTCDDSVLNDLGARDTELAERIRECIRKMLWRAVAILSFLGNLGIYLSRLNMESHQHFLLVRRAPNPGDTLET